MPTTFKTHTFYQTLKSMKYGNDVLKFCNYFVLKFAI